MQQNLSASEKKEYLIYVVLSILICTIVLLFTDYIYIQYDSYYYLSIVESVLNGTGFKDYTTDPEMGVRTPQNGVVYIYLILHKLGFTLMQEKLNVIAVLNSIFIGISSIMVSKITKKIGIPKDIAFLISVSIPLSFYYQMVLLQGINDAPYILLTLIVLWVVINVKVITRTNFISLLVISLCINHFRLTGIFAFMTGMIHQFFMKEYKGVLVYLMLSIITLISLMLAIYILGFDLSGVSNRSSEIFSSYDITFFLAHLKKTLFLNIPEAVVRLTYFTSGLSITYVFVGISLSGLVILSIFLALRTGFKSKNYAIVSLLSFVLMMLLFFQLHPAQPTRYILTVSILLPIIIAYSLTGIMQKYVIYTMFSVWMILNVVQIYNTDLFQLANMRKNFGMTVTEHFSDKDYRLISYFPRLTYFYIHKRAEKIDKPDQLKLDKEAVIIGPKDFIKSYLDLYKQKYSTYDLNITKYPFGYVGHKKAENYSIFKPYDPSLIYVYGITKK